MIKTIKMWFDDLTTSYDEQKDDDVLQTIFAVVCYHVIKADEKETDEEKHYFNRYFKSCFDLNDEQITNLYQVASSIELNLEELLAVLNAKLENMQPVKYKLMTSLNELIQVDSIDDREYRVFERITKSLF